MNLFYSETKELRSGWKILRVFVFVAILTILFALLSSFLKMDVIGEYAFHSAIIVSILLELRLERKPLSFIGISIGGKGMWKDFLGGIVWGGLSILLVTVGMMAVTREINAGQIGHGIESINWVFLFSFWLIVALGEESLFRGYILSALKGHVNVTAGLIISAVIFSAIHIINPDYYWFAFLYAFLIGVMFGGVVIKRGNLGCARGFHYAWNLLQDKGLLNLPERGGEVVYAVVLLINIGLVYWLFPRRLASVVWPQEHPTAELP